MTPETTEAAAGAPIVLGGRYHLRELLGKGGMATVHRAFDATAGRDVALKLLSHASDGKPRRDGEATFEREFHTLSSLSHPSIIRVYDYGVDASRAFYTMELLDGRDLRERSPLPWKEACALLYDVCSSLALLHSRRFVHRDVSPRNIRCTEDGHAKLIDFGAMVPAGPGEAVVGTPPFAAPEVLNLSLLDARTDLFSFGATLYYALTGRLAFPARSFGELAEIWRHPPVRPSVLTPGIPDSLDTLALSLLSLEPAMRPRTAFEVMQRLAAIAGLERAESAYVSQAYLSTPVLVGREPLMRALREEMLRAFAGRGRCAMIEAAPGLGRTRVLDQVAFEAKAMGAIVLRARPGFAAGSGGSLADSFRTQLDQAGAPDAESAADRRIVGVSRKQPVVVAVDDLHRLGDEPASLLVSLAEEARDGKLLIVMTAESGAEATPAVRALRSRSTSMSLPPLSQVDTEALLASLFGDVPNVEIVGHAIHLISSGNPRACLDVAQHLVDRRTVRYDGGTWSLPRRLDASDLPESAEAAIRTRIAGLSPRARAVAQSQAITFQPEFTRQQYAALCPGAAAGEVEELLNELVVNQILVSDGHVYTLSHRGWAKSLAAELGGAELVERHRALAAVYESTPGLAAVHHMLEGGLEERGLERLFALLGTVQNSSELREVFALDAYETAATFARALKAAVELDRPPLEITTIRRWLASLSVAADDHFYWLAAPDWLKQLEQDSGYTAWEAAADVADPAERRSRALSQAYAHYSAQPERDRVYRPDEAIRLLVHYVAISIAIGSRCQDVALIKSLPPLLEPFAPLAPGVDAILHNAMATREARAYAQPEKARARWKEVLERLDQMTPDQVESLHVIRHAIASGIGSVESQMGLASATKWAELLERDQLQQIHALYIKKIVRLQQGDWEGAERFRRKAERLEISARARQMFTSSLMIEVAAHAMASDLTGLKQVLDRIEPLAAKFPGWAPYRHVAIGHFERIRGNLEAARREYELALERATPDDADETRAVPAFPPAAAGLVETLTALGAAEQALTFGEDALKTCAARGIGVSAHDVARETALADARLGNFGRAAERIEAVIEQQRALGVTGLNLGASYEARARVAIWANDEAAVKNYGALTAREYRHGRGSPLGARYERLMAEADKVAASALPQLSDIGSTSGGFSILAGHSSVHSSHSHDAVVTQAMTGAETREARSRRALVILCGDAKAEGGHLYLAGDDGLYLAASVGDEAPPDELLDFATRAFERLGDFVTMTIAASSETFPSETSRFTTASGITFDPVLLTCSVPDVRHAGVAVLRYGELPHRPPSPLLASAVGAHLIRSGDTAGLPV